MKGVCVSVNRVNSFILKLSAWDGVKCREMGIWRIYRDTNRVGKTGLFCVRTNIRTNIKKSLPPAGAVLVAMFDSFADFEFKSNSVSKRGIIPRVGH